MDNLSSVSACLIFFLPSIHRSVRFNCCSPNIRAEEDHECGFSPNWAIPSRRPQVHGRPFHPGRHILWRSDSSFQEILQVFKTTLKELKQSSTKLIFFCPLRTLSTCHYGELELLDGHHWGQPRTPRNRREGLLGLFTSPSPHPTTLNTPFSFLI